MGTKLRFYMRKWNKNTGTLTKTANIIKQKDQCCESKKIKVKYETEHKKIIHIKTNRIIQDNIIINILV
jgi:hypothetical protein